MKSNKQLLHYLMDIGGVATLNNLYSKKSKSYKGSLDNVRDLRDFWLENKLIRPLEPYIGYKPIHQANELFYIVTLQGAEFIGRKDEYKNKVKSISISNIEHESCKFDVLISLVRLYPDYYVEIDYPRSVAGVRPDARIKMTHKKDRLKIFHFYLEIERKEKLHRVMNTINNYKNLNGKGVPLEFRVLVVYSHLYAYPSFARPQQYPLLQESINENLERTEALTGHRMPPNILVMSQSDFYRLNEPVWFTPMGKRIKLIL